MPQRRCAVESVLCLLESSLEHSSDKGEVGCLVPVSREESLTSVHVERSSSLPGHTQRRPLSSAVKQSSSILEVLIELSGAAMERKEKDCH